MWFNNWLCPYLLCYHFLFNLNFQILLILPLSNFTNILKLKHVEPKRTTSIIRENKAGLKRSFLRKLDSSFCSFSQKTELRHLKFHMNFGRLLVDNGGSWTTHCFTTQILSITIINVVRRIFYIHFLGLLDQPVTVFWLAYKFFKRRVIIQLK